MSEEAEKAGSVQDDTDLIEAALRIIYAKGRLISRRVIWINGIGHQPSIYGLTHIGAAPDDVVAKAKLEEQ